MQQTLLILLFSIFSLIKTGDRTYGNYTLSVSEKNQIQKNTKGLSKAEIIEYCLKHTSKKLHFSKKNNINNGEANCVGYSQYYASICNYSFKVNGISNCSCKPVVGYINLCGINLCKFAKSMVPTDLKNFVKNHDFIEYTNNDKTIYFDPLIYDYTEGLMK